MREVSSTTAAEQGVHWATTYLSLARALSYPTPAVTEAIVAGELVAGLRAALAGVDTTDAQRAALDEVVAATTALPPADIELAEEYTYLFLRQAPAPPYESSYGRGRMLGRVLELEEVGRFYAAFGLQVTADHPDLPDHIGAQLEFVGLLHAKEAYALDTGQDEAAAICREARAMFTSQHLLSWLPRFQERLNASARLTYYPALANLALALLRAETSADVASDPVGEAAPPDDDDFTCPAAPAGAEE